MGFLTEINVSEINQFTTHNDRSTDEIFMVSSVDREAVHVGFLRKNEM